MIDANRDNYFFSLFNQSLQLIERFPITINPAGMSYITEILEPAVIAARASNPFINPTTANAPKSQPDVPIGLNTIGMLLDRLTILSMKHWNLVNRSKSSDKAKVLVDTQIMELVAALNASQPGQSSVNNKITTRKVSVEISDFREAFFGLMTTNMLLWEAQEILYNHDISTLPDSELRGYIDFFSRGNIERNEYIQASDILFWNSVER